MVFIPSSFLITVRKEVKDGAIMVCCYDEGGKMMVV
jgi:hypothetical protein